MKRDATFVGLGVLVIVGETPSRRVGCKSRLGKFELRGEGGFRNVQ